MRRRDRAVTDLRKITEILRACRVCRLAMLADGRPYIVPMNFGFAMGEDGALSLYFHTAPEGRKLDALRAGGSVAFELDCGHAVLGEGAACSYSFAYASVIGTGRVTFLEDAADKRAALTRLMEQATGRAEAWTFEEKMLARTCVFRLDAEEYAAKRHRKPG